MRKECQLGLHDHLLCYDMTAKEQRSVRVVMEMTKWTEEEALEFVRVFQWHITQSPGGAPGLIKRLQRGENIGY